MGFITNMLGAGANDYNASHIKVFQGADEQQIKDALGSSQGTAAQQARLARQMRGGVQNQQGVFQNLGQFYDAMKGASSNGNNINFGSAEQTQGQTQGLIQQLLGVANGTGPNPAQAQFQQNISQAVKQQAGGMASMRGLNPALAARLSANAGSNMMQGAASNAAVLQAQQQLGAQEAAGNLLSNLSGQQASQAQAQTSAQQGYASLAAQTLAQQAGLSTEQVGQLQNQLATMGAQGLNQQQILQAALANYNSARIQQDLGIQGINAGVSGQNAQIGSQMFGGIMGAAGAGLGALAMFSDERLKKHVVRHEDDVIPGVPRATFEYRGDPSHTEYEGVIAQDVERVAPDLVGRSQGYRTVPAELGPVPVDHLAEIRKQVRNYAGGGDVVDVSAYPYAGYGAMDPNQQLPTPSAYTVPPPDPGPSPLEKYAGYGNMVGAGPTSKPAPSGASVAGGVLSGFSQGMSSSGGGQDVSYHPMGGEHFYLPVLSPTQFAYGGRTYDLRNGGRVVAGPGQHPVVDGDSEKNDRVPAMLTEGEGVIPRTKMDDPDEAHAFLDHLLKKRSRAGAFKRYTKTLRRDEVN